MKKYLFVLFAVLTALSLSAQQKKICFAVLSDTHLGSYAYALDDLNKAIDDINARPDIQFVIISGDITEFGTDQEIEGTRQVLSRLTKKYLFVPGNHDTNWSESGCTTFNKVMGGSSSATCTTASCSWASARAPTCGWAPARRLARTSNGFGKTFRRPIPTRRWSS